MRPLHYLEVENFKRFGEKQRICLGHPAVLVGPNNCGKTSATQAIALWSLAVKTWFAAKGSAPPKDRPATALNRLNIVSVPVLRTRNFWHDMVVRRGARNVEMTITAGVWHEGAVVPVTMVFRNQGEDIVYCQPGPGTLDCLDAIEAAAGIDVELLYPMSGIEAEEPLLRPGRIDVLMGQGQTAQSLRNLCLYVARRSETDWQSVVRIMERLFSVRFEAPAENARGSIDLQYRQDGAKRPMDVSMAGRGLQQMLLLLAYLHLHPKSVLLIDEPDAHLEILRQRQVYVLLREIAERRGSQVVVATHSEVIVNEAESRDVTLLLEGRAHRLPKPGPAVNALRHYGTEHYVRARDRGYVLYVEGTTDIDLLEALAARLEHPVASAWDERANVYYLRDVHSAPRLHAELDRVEGGFGMTAREHFFVLRQMIPGLRGLAILDGNTHPPAAAGAAEAGLRIVRWDRCEAENYFVTPDLLVAYAQRQEHDAGPPGLFYAEPRRIADRLALDRVFGGDEGDFEAWKKAEPAAARLIWDAKSARVKMSDFAEAFFRELSEATGSPMLLRKRTLHRLVAHADPAGIPSEATEKLDRLEELFAAAVPAGGR